jgi:hypothetical protein
MFNYGTDSTRQSIQDSAFYFPWDLHNINPLHIQLTYSFMQCLYNEHKINILIYDGSKTDILPYELE